MYWLKISICSSTRIYLTLPGLCFTPALLSLHTDIAVPVCSVEKTFWQVSDRPPHPSWQWHCQVTQGRAEMSCLIKRSCHHTQVLHFTDLSKSRPCLSCQHSQVTDQNSENLSYWIKFPRIKRKYSQEQQAPLWPLCTCTCAAASWLALVLCPVKQPKTLVIGESRKPETTTQMDRRQILVQISYQLMEVPGLFLHGTSDLLQAVEFPKAPVWHGSSHSVIRKNLAFRSQIKSTPDLSVLSLNLICVVI